MIKTTVEWPSQFPFYVATAHLPLNVVMAASVDIDPDHLNLGSKGQKITAYIDLPDGFDEADIDISTVKLEELGLFAEAGEVQTDGVSQWLMVKFPGPMCRSTASTTCPTAPSRLSSLYGAS